MARGAGEARKAERKDFDDGFGGVVGALAASILRDEARLPEALSQRLNLLDAGTVTSATVSRSIVEHTPRIQPSLAAALIEIGETADRSSPRNTYHNPAHFRDVGVVFFNLARLERMLSRQGHPDLTNLIVGCCAAFGHDIGHDGGTSGDEAFRLERIAANAVGAIMGRHGVDARLVERAQCAILMTDNREGYRILDGAARGALATLPPDAPPSIRLIQEPETRRLAFLLRDADVLQSAGLSPEDHDRQTRRLEQEQGIPRNALGARGADFFLREMIRGHFLSEAGAVFQPRLGRLLYLNGIRHGDAIEGEGLADIARREASQGV